MHYQEYKSILSPKNGMNIYRGCTHGCIYCDSRSSCYNMKHDFCDIEIKKNAPQMLEDALKRKRKKCMIGTGTEENFRKLLNYCIEAKVYGIVCFGIGLTLRDGNREYFYKKLDEHFPYMKQKYIKTFGNFYECKSTNQSKLMKILYYECKKHNILVGMNNVFSYLNSYENKNVNEQISLF